MNKFSIRDNWKDIDWKNTFIVNLYRSLTAGIVLCIILLIGEDENAFAFLLFPVMYFIVFLPLGLLFSNLCEKYSAVWCLLAIFISLLVTLGDPLVYILRLIKKELVPVEKFYPLNFKIIIFVLKTN